MTTLLRTIAVLWLAGCVWLATHKSRYPVHFGRYSTEFLALLICMFLTGGILALVAVRAGRASTPWRPLRGLVALIVSIPIALLVAEGTIRAFDLFGASFYREITRYILDLEPDPQLVYRQRPGLSKTYQGVQVNINAQGLRERPITPKAPGVKRVLLLGDSVTFGWGVKVDDTFGRVAERELTQRLGVPIRTINSGVCGYNTDQELAFLRREGEILAPDVIVLMYVDNDVDPAATDFVSMRKRWFHPQGASAVLLKYSWLYRLYHTLLPNFFRGDPNGPSSPGWKASMRSLEAIGQYGVTHHIPVAVFFFRLTASPLGNRLSRDVANAARSSGALYEDLLPLFRGRNIRALTNSLVDIHPNAAGDALIGRAVAKAIEPMLRAGRSPSSSITPARSARSR